MTVQADKPRKGVHLRLGWRRLAPVAALGWALSGAPGCKGTVHTQGEPSCATSDDCASGWICDAGACRWPCNTTADCPGKADVCVSGLCKSVTNSFCGDGILLAADGEACDDGNNVTEACTYGQVSCTVCAADCSQVAGATSYCGDTIVDGANGEECDDGNATTEACAYGLTSCTVCNATCKNGGGLTSYCGDDVIDAAHAENCDDGNAVTEPCAYGLTSCTVCNSSCALASGATSYCGDSVVDATNSEQCDTGGATTMCTAACRSCSVASSLDQQLDLCSLSAITNCGDAFFSATQLAAQGFVAGKSGNLEKVVLYIGNDTSSLVSVAIVYGGADPLALTTYSPAQVTANTLATATLSCGVARSWVTFTFANAPAVTAGSTYYIVATLASPSGTSFAHWGMYNDYIGLIDSYPPGRAFWDLPATNWGAEPTYRDHEFQVYIGNIVCP